MAPADRFAIVVSKAELKKRRVQATKAQARQEQVVERTDRRRRRWLTVGVVFLAVMLILPLAAGFFIDADSVETDAADVQPLDLNSTPPSLVDPGFEGASLTGETPCPATDGTQSRVTSFESAPVACVDVTATYSVELGTVAGPVTVDLDAVAAPEGTNLFVSLARYGVYEGARITTEFEGLVVLGNFGDVGFNVPATEVPADGQYPVGSIALLTELGSGAMTGQAVVVTSEVGAELLASDGTSPIIGTVSEGIDVFAELTQLGEANPETVYRLRSADVTETVG